MSICGQRLKWKSSCMYAEIDVNVNVSVKVNLYASISENVNIDGHDMCIWM